MYELTVFCPDVERPTEKRSFENAADALAAIPKLMEDHPGCERVEVYLNTTRLFTVDCEGNTIPG